MDRAPAPPRRAARLLGPTAISMLVHAALLILLFVFTARPRTAPAGTATARILANAALDPAEADDADAPAPPEVEVEAFEDVPLEPEFVVPTKAIDTPTPVPVCEEEANTLEPLDPSTTRVADEDQPTLAAARTRLRPEPVAPPRRAIPAPRPAVVAAAATLSRPPPPAALRRPVTRRRTGRRPGRTLRAIHKPVHYPPSARQRGLQGRARIELSIDASGRVTAVVLVASSGYVDLDQAALASARQWRFHPPGERRRVRTWLVFRLT